LPRDDVPDPEIEAKIARPIFGQGQRFVDPDRDKALYNLDLERGVLGALLYDNSTIDQITPLIAKEHFFDRLHAEIFDVAVKLIQSGKKATAITLRTYFEQSPPVRDGLSVPKYLGSVVAEAATRVTLQDYAANLRSMSVSRGAVVRAEDLIAKMRAPDPDAPIAVVLDNFTVDIGKLRDEAAPPGGFGSLQIADETSAELNIEYVIKGVLARLDIAAAYGPTQAGKTFLALDLTWAIAQGKRWRGRRVKRAPVLYIPLEGRSGFRNRVRAMVMEHGATDGYFAWLDAPIVLSRGALGDASEAHIIREAKTLARRCPKAGKPPEQVGAIVIDTYARALGGDVENDADSVAALMARLDRISRATGAAILLTAHPGKDATKGLRGSYALPAALDVVLRVEREGDAPERTVHVEKMRDGEEGQVDAFTLKTIHLGEDQDGDPVASCVIAPAKIARAKKPKSPKPGSAAAKALDELADLVLTGHGEQVANGRAPPGAECVPIEKWSAACRQKGLSTGEDNAERQAFHRAKSDLEMGGIVCVYNGYCWRLKSATTEASVTRPIS
jgi:AAA domain/DnaB-like helicase N terminal domain